VQRGFVAAGRGADPYLVEEGGELMAIESPRIELVEDFQKGNVKNKTRNFNIGTMEFRPGFL
jgi:hypothetical protein